MSEIITTLRERLTARRAEQFRLLGELIRVRSDSPPGDGRESADLISETLENLGLPVTRHEPPQDLLDDMGLMSAPCLVARYEAGPGPTLTLVAGLDTRAAPAGSGDDAFSGVVSDGVIQGMGARNRKSSACAMIYGALGAIETTALTGTIEIVLTHDSESGGYVGTKWLLDENIIAPDMAIVAAHGDAVITHHPGILHFAVDLHIDPKRADSKSDALNAAHAVMGAAYETDGRLSKVVSPIEGVGSPALIVGAIEAGERADRRPHDACLWLGRRYLPNEDVTTVRRAMSTMVGKALAGRRGVQCKVRPVLMDSALAASPETRPIAAAILKAAQDGPGRRLAARGWDRPTEARFFAEKGIPAVAFGCGPALEPNDESMLESLSLDHLRSSTEVFSLAIASLLAPISE